MALSSATDIKPTLGLLLAQSRVLRALAGGAVLQGTPDELIQRLDVRPEGFRAALQNLVEGGWIFTTTTRDGQLVVGRERRLHHDSPPGPFERRRPAVRGGPTSLWEGGEAPQRW